jgi:Helitron helicase-like domain at N-terminus
LNLTPKSLEEATEQARTYESIIDPSVRELLKMISQMRVNAPGSDEHKSYLLVQLKSSILFQGLPLIFLTLNPGDRHSSIVLLYAGEKIDVKRFVSELWSACERVRIALDNPVAVVEYFHRTINAIINTLLKKGTFGKLKHYFGPIEYQRRRTPHTHLLVNSVSYPQR